MKKALFTQCPLSDQEIELLKNEGVEIIKASGDLGEEKLIESLQGYQIYIIGGADKATKNVIAKTNLELIIFYGTGYENYIDVSAAHYKGISVANTPKANAYTVAEHAVALILDSVKQITHLNNTTKQGQWLRRQTWNLQNKTIGIVGLGTIGSSVARIMHHAFNMKIVYFGRVSKPELEKELGARKVDLDTLMSTSDVVTIHAAYGDETVGMVGEKQLNEMQSHAALVCTSRAELIDPVALKIALEGNKLAIAAFDSYYKEPVPNMNDDSWGLLSLPDNKFIITPHTAYGSKEAITNMNNMVVENIISFIKSGEPTYSVEKTHEHHHN